MTKIAFTKVVASGNDFIVIDKNNLSSFVHRPSSIVKSICDRKYGAGADGALLLEKSKKADIRMRIFNADGSEADMCGNGARSAALYYSQHRAVSPQPSALKIETKAGIIEARVLKDTVKIKLTDPKEYQKKIPLVIHGRKLKVNFINTGVPHTIVFVQGIEQIDVTNIGREIRYHKYFSPAGTNVNFVEIVNKTAIKARTYERGVEDETLACGTGVAASAIVFALQSPAGQRAVVGPPIAQAIVSRQQKINVLTQGGEILRVYFKKDGNEISDVWLEGRAKIVYKGEFYV